MKFVLILLFLGGPEYDYDAAVALPGVYKSAADCHREALAYVPKTVKYVCAVVTQ